MYANPNSEKNRTRSKKNIAFTRTAKPPQMLRPNRVGLVARSIYPESSYIRDNTFMAVVMPV